MVPFSKQTIAGLLTGAMMFGAVTLPTIQVFAADTPAAQTQQVQTTKTKQHKQLDPDKASQRIAAMFNVDKNDVLNLYNNGHKLKDISRAACFAEVSGKSLNDVMAMKTADNTWKDVEGQLGLSKDQIKAERNVIMGRMMNQRFGVDAQSVTDLLNQDHNRRDVMAAALLSKESGKAITDVIALKTQDNKWQDVAQTLGVSDQFKQEMQQFHHPKGHHHKQQHTQQ